MFKKHSRQIQKNMEKFFDQNISGPKFILDLSFDSHDIHVRNTFPTDSKADSEIFGKSFSIKIFLDPNFF